MGGRSDSEMPNKRSLSSEKPEPAKKRKRYEQKPVRASRRDERREVMTTAKAMWEQLRPKATSKEKSISLVDDLLRLLSGRIVEFVFRHDGSRIAQWMLNDGNESQKRKVMTELIEGSNKPTMQGEASFFVKLACDRYGRHLAGKMLRVADKDHKTLIFERYLRGNVAQLIRNVHGADLLDSAYQTVLNSRTKAEVVLELLYSREKKLLETVRGKIFTGEARLAAVEGSAASQSMFAKSLDAVGDTFKDVAVEGAAIVLNQLVDKEGLLRFEMVHAAFKEYLHIVMSSYPKEKSQEIAAQLAPMLVHFAHTKPGVYVAINCVKLLDAKHRKKTIRGLKTHIRKLLEDEYGHRLLLAIFEWVDDTRLVGKTISTEVFSDSKLAPEMAELEDSTSKRSSRGGKQKASTKSMETSGRDSKGTAGIDLDYLQAVCEHKYARMPLLNLFFGRDTRYFNPDVYSLVWSDIDEKFDKTSKKDPDTRRTELRLIFERPLSELIRTDIAVLLRSHWSAPVVLGALLNASTRDAVADGLTIVLKDKDEMVKLVTDTCARKTLATMFKIGSSEFASAVLKTCGTGLVSSLAGLDRCMPIAQNLVNASGRLEAKEALQKVTEAS